MRFFQFSVLLLAWSFYSCKSSSRLVAKDDGKLEMVFVQVNDVYEIAPLNAGKSGGIARVATLKQQYKKANPNTFLTVSGDFLSPSVFNSLRFEGKAIRGKQMVDALNSAGLDLAVFGNHEFDITETELQERLNESSFDWVASNVLHVSGDQALPFEKRGSSGVSPIPPYRFLNLRDADGTTVRVGIIGLTIASNRQPFVQYRDPLETGAAIYGQIKDSCDAVVAITHLSLEDDVELAKRVPGLALILGGHEHDMHLVKTGNLYISKAHANAKSAYIIKLMIDKRKKQVSAVPRLVMIDEKIALDSATAAVVQKWMDIGSQNYASLGFDARQTVMRTGDTLNGLETDVRTGSTNLTEIIGKAIAAAYPQAEAVLYNSGSIRLDDRLPPPVTQYDIIRALPFGGSVLEVEMMGSLLLQVLEAGDKNRGSGGYLQRQGITYDSVSRIYKIKGNPLNSNNSYRLALNDFLLTGLEQNLGFLKKDNPGITSILTPAGNTADIRLAIIRYLQNGGRGQ